MCEHDACEIPDARLNNLNHELMEIARVIVIAIHMDDIILVYLSARIAVTTVLHEENLVASEPVIFGHLMKFPPEAAVTVEHDDAALRRILLRCMVVLNRNAVICGKLSFGHMVFSPALVGSDHMIIVLTLPDDVDASWKLCIAQILGFRGVYPCYPCLRMNLHISLLIVSSALSG